MTRTPSWSGLWVPLQSSSLYMMLCLDHMWFLNTPVCWVGQLCLTLWPHGLQTATLLSMEFSRQEYWNELLFPTSRDLPDPGFEPVSLASLSLVGRFFTTVPHGKPWFSEHVILFYVSLNRSHLGLFGTPPPPFPSERNQSEKVISWMIKQKYGDCKKKIQWLLGMGRGGINRQSTEDC